MMQKAILCQQHTVAFDFKSSELMQLICAMMGWLCPLCPLSLQVCAGLLGIVTGAVGIPVDLRIGPCQTSSFWERGSLNMKVS